MAAVRILLCYLVYKLSFKNSMTNLFRLKESTTRLSEEEADLLKKKKELEDKDAEVVALRESLKKMDILEKARQASGDCEYSDGTADIVEESFIALDFIVEFVHLTPCLFQLMTTTSCRGCSMWSW